MKPVQFIYFVENQGRSREFYSTVLEKSPLLDVPGMTQFELNENSILGLMPVENIKKILGENHFKGNYIDASPKSELYLYVENIERKIFLIKEAKGEIISPPELRNWGDFAAYCKDLDGNIIAFAEKK